MKTQISKDLKNKKIIIVREFSAPLENVWDAWTQSELLDQWWAPKPWKAKSKKMNFVEGGSWLYGMVGPDGTEVWGLIEFIKIIPHKAFEAMDFFCDENGNKNTDFASMNWKNDFTATVSGTKVHVEINFAEEADMEKIIEMGFESGFTSAHDNLDELLATEFKIINK